MFERIQLDWNPQPSDLKLRALTTGLVDLYTKFERNGDGFMLALEHAAGEWNLFFSNYYESAVFIRK